MFVKIVDGLSGMYVLIAAAGGVPVVDIANTCRVSEKAVTALFGNQTPATYDSCMRQQEEARALLVKDWAKYPQSDRQLCVNVAGYMPGYVEWLTCFEMQTYLREMRKTAPSGQMSR
jgi:hypothetical protein